MRILSATECITPAIERTKLILFSPFRKGRTWKLCATAYVSTMGVMYLPFPLLYLGFLPLVSRTGSRPLIVGLVIVALLLTALWTWIFHLCSRLQFAYFDIVVNRGEFVAPAWRKYRAQALPWTGVKILAGSILTLVCAIPLTAYFRHLIPAFRSMIIAPGQQPPPQFFRAMLSVYAGEFVLALGFGAVYLIGSILTNFLLPSLALENTGIHEAFRRMTELIRREPGEFAIFVLLKTGLGVAAYIGATVVWEIVFFLVTFLLGAIVLLFGFLLHLAGVPTIVLTVLGVLLAVAWYVFAIFYSLMLAIGPAWTFLDAYALYFLGGRYPMLGALLDQSTPPAPPLPAYPYPAAYMGYPPPTPNPAGDSSPGKP